MVIVVIWHKNRLPLKFDIITNNVEVCHNTDYCCCMTYYCITVVVFYNTALPL